MTPAIKVLQKSKIHFTQHEYDHDPKAESYGLEAAEKLGVEPKLVFKTLVVQVDAKDYAVAVIPVEHLLNLKLIAKAFGGKKAAMGQIGDVERITGYVVGGVSPLGQKKRLKTFLDESAQKLSTIYVSAGKRGMDIALSPSDLLVATGGQFAPLIHVD
jgi:Cys-tRNA(Pro)/Cys-tRNA(Cys) deacylase